MKIQVIKRENVEDWRDRLTIEIDGFPVFDVSDGEPEDNNLDRNFQDCRNVVDLMKRAWEAGKKGESFSAETKQKGWEEE